MKKLLLISISLLALSVAVPVAAQDVREAVKKAEADRASAEAHAREVESRILTDRGALMKEIQDLQSRRNQLEADIKGIQARRQAARDRHEKMTEKWSTQEVEFREISGNVRMAAKDIELGGVRIPKGAVIDVAAGAANRDPSRFPNPDKFDIFRKPQHKHFAFAYGPHVCIGQHLARVEMTRALNAILDHLPGLRLDPDKPAPEIRGVMMRVPKHLHVRFDA